MASESDTLMSFSSAPQTRVSPKYHLLSTIVISVWSLFILGTVLIHELAHSRTRNVTRILADKDVSWIYRSGLGLPSILRTIFSQAHGPITAMHLARLAVGALDVSWASPKTWTEIFWFANRRWSGPVGLTETGWVMVTRLRFSVSLCFCLFAILSIVALGTPVVMTRAYPVTKSHIDRGIQVMVRKPHSPLLSVASGAQLSFGQFRWATGVSTPALSPQTVYARHGANYSKSSGDWFIASPSRGTELMLYGIRVVGGCEVITGTPRGPAAFLKRCKDEFGTGLNPDVLIASNSSFDGGITEVKFGLFTNASSCSDITQKTPFGLNLQSSALFRTWSEDVAGVPEIIMRCNATTGVGAAYVNGRSMKFSGCNPSPLYGDKEPFEYVDQVDPIAAITRTSLLVLKQSIFAKHYRYDTGTVLSLCSAAMWDGVLAMSLPLWILWDLPETNTTGLQRLEASGIHRENSVVIVLAILLSVWFAGMLLATLALLRPTWSSTFDSYAIARMLQHQPVVSKADEVWFSELEDNEELRQQFEMRRWRAKQAQS